MKILFLSGAYAKEMEGTLQSYCKNVSLSIAANVFQWAVIKGLQENHADFEVLSFPFLPCYPLRFKHLKTPAAHLLLDGEAVGEMASYSAMIFYKDFSIRRILRKKLKEWLRHNYSQNENIIILTYTPEAIFVNTAYEMKKKFPGIKICSIVTELVDFTGMAASNKTFLKKIQMDRERKATKESYNKIDKFILLTKAMEDLIPQAQNNSLVVEGIYSPSERIIPLKGTQERVLVYTGSLQEYVGIKDLVDAFCLTKNDKYKLIICGSGYCAAYIHEKALKDKRIEFRGVVSRKEALELQTNATALINPRKPSEDFTKYSFPSKTMEYLASGTPVIGYFLTGMPAEYKEHLFIPKNLTMESLANEIDVVLSLPDNILKDKADRARTFVLEKKTSKNQVKRILRFLNN